MPPKSYTKRRRPYQWPPPTCLPPRSPFPAVTPSALYRRTNTVEHSRAPSACSSILRSQLHPSPTESDPKFHSSALSAPLRCSVHSPLRNPDAPSGTPTQPFATLQTFPKESCQSTL